MRAVIYARVSRAPYASTDTSTPRQIANCRSFLDSKGWYEHGVHRDVDRSAFKPGIVRSGFEALLRDITTGEIDVVVVWKLDRLTRRAADFERFWSLCEQHRVALASVTEPIDTTAPVGLAIVRMLLTFAGVESTVRGERLAARHKEQALEGQPFPGGRRPYGHTRELTEIVESEADVLREAARRVIDGELLTAVARGFEQRGIVGSHGKPWSRAGLKSTLVSARMVGDRSYHGEVVATSCFAPILDRDAHQLVQLLLKGVTKRTRPTRGLLQGLMICGRCGSHLVSSVSNRGTGIYKCPGPPQGCQRISVSKPHAEPIVIEAARRRLRSGSPMPDVEVDHSQMARLNELNKAYFSDKAITRTEWYSTRRQIVNDSANRACWWRLHPDIPPGQTARQLDAHWETLTVSAQRAVLAAIVSEVEVAPTSRGGGFHPERLTIRLEDVASSRASTDPPTGERRETMASPPSLAFGVRSVATNDAISTA